MSTTSPTPNSTNLVSAILLGVIILLAIAIPVLSDHPVKVPWLFVGPVFMAGVLYFARPSLNGYLVAAGFAASVILTCLAI